MPVSEHADARRARHPHRRGHRVESQSGPLGERVFDDLFTGLAQPATFAVEGGGRRVEVVFEEGYPVAQVFAPEGSDFICFEPMTAPTNALVSGDGLRCVDPGADFTARFSIAVSCEA